MKDKNRSSNTYKRPIAHLRHIGPYLKIFSMNMNLMPPCEFSLPNFHKLKLKIVFTKKQMSPPAPQNDSATTKSYYPCTSITGWESISCKINIYNLFYILHPIWIHHTKYWILLSKQYAQLQFMMAMKQIVQSFKSLWSVIKEERWA
jgi:hypothetical protein